MRLNYKVMQIITGWAPAFINCSNLSGVIMIMISNYPHLI